MFAKDLEGVKGKRGGLGGVRMAVQEAGQLAA